VERELWPLLYRLVREVGADFSQKHARYPPWAIACVLLWAAVHDRPLSWACDRRHWSTTRLRPAALPSPATLSRRLRGLAVGLLLRALEGRLRDAAPPGLVGCLDGKPLPVGGRSHDPAARPKGPLGPGYKLHAVWDLRPAPAAWEVTAAGVGEAPVAERLVGRAAAGGYLLADGNYDSNALFDAAGGAGYQLVVPAWREGAGRGHRYQSPYRLRSIALAATAYGHELYALRGRIERSFGNAGGFGGGLGPLPPWVRGGHRVHCWVAAKLLINAARIARKQGLAA
jgi:IS5 family transposase